MLIAKLNVGKCVKRWLSTVAVDSCEVEEGLCPAAKRYSRRIPELEDEAVRRRVTDGWAGPH